ncbi:hypothetical protein DOY81_012094 [Sarcophaga bullata]|nr:hypothetical protein DOY81_012094 [Sarcophaga bullata]
MHECFGANNCLKKKWSRKEELRQRNLRKPPPKASDIFVREMDNSFANIRGFLQNLLNNIEIRETKVGESFDYPDGIIERRIYLDYGIFMNYFIRKHLSNQYLTDITDLLLKSKFKTIYISPLKSHYGIFQNPETNAMKILESIKIVSLAYSATYDEEKVRNVEIDSRDEMLEEIIKHFETHRFENVELTPRLDCEYFRAVPDFIFNIGKEEVLYDIKTSKHVTLEGGLLIFRQQTFTNLLHMLMVTIKGPAEYKTFRIYNPLLGYEHEIVMNNINFKEFERCLESDYVKKYGQNWRQDPPESW